MIDDDEPVGRVLTRREALQLIALSSVALACNRDTQAQVAAGEVLPACLVKPELTVGPYFVDHQLDRSDIRVEPTTGAAKAGVPLALTFNVSDVTNGSCKPLGGAMVDVWHCDADGVYSGVHDGMMGVDTSAQKFLRGYQITDKNGVARFTTIYPGWYRGRTVHLHFKVRTPANSDTAYEFTSQLFFDEALSDRVYANAPYAKTGTRDTRNADDGIFRESGGKLMLAVAESPQGQRASFDIGLDLSDARTGRPDRSGGRGGPGGPLPRRRPSA